MNKIHYLIDVQPERQTYNAALNRVKSIKSGFDLSNIESEILLINKKNLKCSLYRWARAFIYVLIQLIKAKKNDIFIFYGKLPHYLLIPFFKRKLKFVIELNEFPAFLIKQREVDKKEKQKEEHRLRKLHYFDGLITCSKALSSYYSNYLKENAKIHICPLIVDVEKFSPQPNIERKNNYFAYCGRLGNNKDGVPILIDSFASFAKEVDFIKLYIVGNASESVERELKTRVESLEMSDRIVFTGAIPHNELIPILQNAQLLLLARPNNKQAEGGIPSKIGEYMAAKVPMIVTKVGELESFLEDSVNCFMAEPDSIASFKNKMLEAYFSPDKDKIAEKAFETVQQFGIKNQSRLIHEFCKKL
ncbi:Glycosyl transferases group 1 [anaerobic digester metagenome]